MAPRHADDANFQAQELALLIDGIVGYAIYMLDPKGFVTIWNKGAERLKGWVEAEVLGQHSSIFYPQQAVESGEPQADLDEAQALGRLQKEEWRLRKNGTEFLAHVTITPLYGPDSELRGFGKVVRDVTDERAVERRLQANASQIESILATVPDAMIVINERGDIISFSSAAERMFGLREADVVGSNVSRLMPAPDRDRHDSYLERYLATGERRIIGVGRTVTGRRGDGTTFPMELSVGEAIGESAHIFTGFVRDLTEQRAAEQRIEELRSGLLHASRVSAMGTMASTLAHELNQPITAVVNYVTGVRNLLAENNPTNADMIGEALDEAVNEAMRAGNIVRRLREFVSRGDAEKTVAPLQGLVDDAAKLALIGAREKGIETRFRLDADLPAVMVDRVQTQQLLINLMRNAIEAMAESSERVLTISAAAESPNLVHVIVEDTGRGVPPEVAHDLFQAFNSTKPDGMGLGLSICRTIVEANGGRLWMEPRKGGGSAFHFTLFRAEGESVR